MKPILSKVIQKFRRAWQIFRKEGLLSLFGKTFTFLKYFIQISNEEYFIYENNLDGPTFLNKLPGLEMKILTCKEDLEDLISKNYIFKSWSLPVLTNILQSEAMAFCAVVYKDVAHITWVALNEDAKSHIDQFPFEVDWENEVCSGTSLTDPSFSRKGIYTYVYTEIFKYIKKIGKSKDKFTIAKENIASTNALLKFNSKVIGEGSRRQILWMVFWSQK